VKWSQIFKELTGTAAASAELGLVARLVRRMMRESWRRGIVGGSPTWTVAGGLALLGYLAGRGWERQAEVIFSEPLQPGQTFQITHEHVSLP
jgi:hypothetical protein